MRMRDIPVRSSRETCKTRLAPQPCSTTARGLLDSRNWAAAWLQGFGDSAFRLLQLVQDVRYNSYLAPP
jgi:hypothetical protein